MSMSKPKRRTPAAPAKNPKLDKEEKEETPQTEKTMNDLPPEVLTIILEHTILNQQRNDMLVYRLVSSQWKEIVDSLLEKEVISRRLEAFPEMKIGGQPDQLSVYCPQTVFRARRNPLTFNSLLFNGYKDFPQDPADTEMALPIFMTRFGCNLTTFALQDQIIGTKSLAAMLRSMSNLKCLCLEDVELTKRSIGPGGILQPLPLPSLTTLELKSGTYYYEEDKKVNPLYVWLIASYADQLVRLTLEIVNSLPALQKSYEYSVPWLRGEKVSIATTSASAFGKLKVLHVYSSNSQFLRFTQTPALQLFLIRGWSTIELGDLKKFIGTCGNSLQEVSLDVFRYDFETVEGIHNMSTEGLVGTNVKKLTLDFFLWTRNEFTNINNALLSMFPALEVLQLLHYNSRDHEMTDYDHRSQGQNLVGLETNGSNVADEISSLKLRSASLWEAAFEIRDGDDEDDDDFGQRYEAFTNARNKRAYIFKRLAALGENLDKVVVEEMLEHRGVWNIFPNIKIVSVSTDREPVGDVCLIRRMDDA